MKFYPTLDETLSKRFEPGTEDGLSEIRDISNHGIDGGFSGFIYHYEINEFFNEFESEIEDRLEDMGFSVADLCDNKSITFQELRTKCVWAVVESWCHNVVETMDELAYAS